jgi:hypothetical protein
MVDLVSAGPYIFFDFVYFSLFSMLPRREVGLVCLGLSVVSALPTGSLANLKRAGYREAGSNPILVVRDQPVPATANKSTSHLKIVIISIGMAIYPLSVPPSPSLLTSKKRL